MIRNIETKDLQSVCDIYNHYVLTARTSFEVDKVPEEEMQRLVGEYTQVYPWLVYEQDGDLSKLKKVSLIIYYVG